MRWPQPVPPFKRVSCERCNWRGATRWFDRNARVNVRVIAASNAPLHELVTAGTFRADLFYRLSVLTIELPPLRERWAMSKRLRSISYAA